MYVVHVICYVVNINGCIIIDNYNIIYVSVVKINYVGVKNVLYEVVFVML
jgi:hypothetical protein